MNYSTITNELSANIRDALLEELEELAAKEQTLAGTPTQSTEK